MGSRAAPLTGLPLSVRTSHLSPVSRQALVDLIRRMLTVSASDRPFIGEVLQLTRAVAARHGDGLDNTHAVHT